MHTFAQRLFFMFGLRRRTALRRTPAALQVDGKNVVELRTRRPLRVGVEVGDGGLQYIKPLANSPRTA